MKKLLLILLFAAPVQASVVKVFKSPGGWQLLVDSEPYIVKGMSYGTDVVGENPNTGNYRDWMVIDDNDNDKIDGPYDAWIDADKNNQQDATEHPVGDFALMRDMGVNTIRIYHHPSDDPLVTTCYPATNPEGQLIWNHPLNKELLRDLFNTYGIRVAMGDEIGSYAGSSCAPWDPGTDYTNAVQIASMTASVRAMVADSKDEPWLLMYILGNENNYSFTHTNAGANPDAYFQFVGQMADLIHSLDPNHPVAIANGELQNMAYARTWAPHLDIFGLNAYRNPGTYTGFGTLWQEAAAVWDKPLLITEFGATNQTFLGNQLNELPQAFALANYWCDIQTHTAGTGSLQIGLGGFIYQWMDSWWQNGDSSIQYHGSPNNETLGIMSQGLGTRSPFLRQPRFSYCLMQNIWNGNVSCNLFNRVQ